MKRTKYIVIALLALMLGTLTVSSQKIPKPQACDANPTQIYYVDSGQMVSEVHPGPNGGNGYQLNILGTDVHKLQVVQEPYMASLAIIAQYTTATSTKWSVTFLPRMEQPLRTIRIRNMCHKGNTYTHNLTAPVKLLDQ